MGQENYHKSEITWRSNVFSCFQATCSSIILWNEDGKVIITLIMQTKKQTQKTEVACLT